MLYGPSRPKTPTTYEGYSTSQYLEGHGAKILYDLQKVARLYNGKEVNIYTLDRTERCPTCINAMTGQQIITGCKDCLGTGYTNGFTFIDSFWVQVNITPKEVTTSTFGNAENRGGRDQFIIIGAPLLEDQSLLIMKDTAVAYKIIDSEPQVTAMQGLVITQMAQCSRLSEGAPEYTLVHGSTLIKVLLKNNRLCTLEGVSLQLHEAFRGVGNG